MDLEALNAAIASALTAFAVIKPLSARRPLTAELFFACAVVAVFLEKTVFATVVAESTPGSAVCAALP